MHCRPILFAALLFSVAFPAVAQTEAVTPAPAPEPPPPPVEVIDDSVQPQVTIRQNENGEIVEEHRVNGNLYQIIVTPENGVPYILVDHTGNGNFSPMDTQGKRLSVPMWVIGTF